MIIFDLDTLADDSHRRHFIDPFEKNIGCIDWQPDYKSYNTACEDDKPIKEVIDILFGLIEMRCFSEFQFWSGRCESFRDKTEQWFMNHGIPLGINLKMRPIGNTEPSWKLKERWLDEYMKWSVLEPVTEDNKGKLYTRNDLPEFVFDSDPESIAMWRRRGVFCFDCRQS